MVKVTFNSALAQKEAKKDEPKSSEEALIVPPDAVAVDCKDPGDVVPVGQRRAWCWCMCFGLAFMLAGVILGGAYLYKYFALQPDDVYYCGLKYIKDDVILNEPSADAPAARYQTIEENIKIFEEDAVEFISVPVPEFADSDPANIVHDFNKKLTAYLDLNLDKCYVIPLNTSIVMPPKNLLELLINIKAGTYLPQSYLIHEHMVITDRIENVDNLGFFIYRLCHDKETYKLQRRETIRGIQKREASNCFTIRHFENKFAVETGAVIPLFTSYVLPTYFLLELLIFLYKGLLLPYPTANLVLDVVMLLLYLGIEVIRLFFGTKGNLCQRKMPLGISVALTFPSAMMASYYLLLQTYVLRLEAIMNSILLFFCGSELLLEMLTLATFSSMDRI